MGNKKLRNKAWYPMAVAGCITVVLYVLLTRFTPVLHAIGTFIGFFSPVLLGCLIAYIVNPLSRLYERSVCKGVKKETGRQKLANILAIVSVLLILALLLLISIPQLISSVTAFAGNLKGYIHSLEGLLKSWGVLDKLGLDDAALIEATASASETAGDFLFDNISDILSATVGAGKGLATFALAFILSIYVLGEREQLKTGSRRLMAAVLGDARSAEAVTFLRRCDQIMNRYIVYNLIDCLLVGVLNAVFMLIVRMPYVGLVSFVVAAANLIPTFGPIIGAAIGAFLLVLVNPWYALWFLVFTAVLQLVDGNIIRPRLFGNSLGVSGLWIMVGVTVGGRMFGIGGILVAIPVVAILDYVYRDILLPRLERRRAAEGAAVGAPAPAGEEPEAREDA